MNAELDKRVESWLSRLEKSDSPFTQEAASIIIDLRLELRRPAEMIQTLVTRGMYQRVETFVANDIKKALVDEDSYLKGEGEKR